MSDIWICGALLDLVPFVQFKKRGKHPWRSVNFSKVSGFLNCTNGSKSSNASHIGHLTEKNQQRVSIFLKK